MARRRRSGPSPLAAWSKLAAASLRHATRAARRLAPPASRRASAHGDVAGLAIRAGGGRHFHLYEPPGLERGVRVPLVVLLHGCRQDADAIAAVTRMNRLAAREGFFVLYPEQDRLAHAQGCWNWYDVDGGRASLEAAIVEAAVAQVCRTHAVDPARIVIGGLSAGASLAALVALRDPRRWAAVVMHSGVAPGVAHDASSALSAMAGHAGPAPPLRVPAGATLPPLLVIHGTADGVVVARNARDTARRWAAALHAKARPTRRVRRGTRRAMQVTDWRAGGRVAVRLCEIEGLAHAWSGGAPQRAYSDPRGPDAARLCWSFARGAFAARGEDAAPRADAAVS